MKTIKTRNILTMWMILLMAIGLQAQAEHSAKHNKANDPVREYTLTLRQEMVNKAGKSVKGMTVNGSIPGPTLEFTEGEYAVIKVKNEMSVETSVHWHGILLPNFFDGVPYLTTPPIEPGETFLYEFPIKQSGTYWYHSHTMLQEQSGVFGSLVIHPKEKTLDYDSDLVLILSDWTNEKPMNVLRNLKRGNEWYGMKKGTSTPLNRVIGRGALGAQFNFWRQRMEGADIADVYYPKFLINGEETQEYPDYKPGEKIRLRIIDGAASTSFWMTFGGKKPLLVSADGLDIVPVKKNKTFIGVAETYDFIVTVPESGKMEFRITAQDGSGKATAFIGSGKLMPAMDIPRPDKIGMMQEMAQMDMKMGAHALKFRPNKDERHEMMKEYGMQMEGMNMKEEAMNMPMTPDSLHKKMDHSKMADHDLTMKKDSIAKMNNKEMDHSKMDHSEKVEDAVGMKKDSIINMNEEEMDHSHMGHSQKANDGMTMKKDASAKMNDDKIDHSKMAAIGMGMKEGSLSNIDGTNMAHSDMKGMDMPGMKMFSEYNYDYLKSPEKTSYDPSVPVNNLLLNLTGNMNRYIWSMNGVPLSETDKIKIKSNEVTRITFNNLTMMHHPMHLHGHFFRVLNENGDYSPLKHTVNVPPMQKLTLEFYGDEVGDWFFHCHILYHMMGGMARIMSYDTTRNPELDDFPVSKLVQETDLWYSWGMVDAASHMSEFNFVTSNIRNQFNIMAEYGWNENLEAEFTYERYLHDYLRIFGGVNVENEFEESLDKLNTTAMVGLRYLTPYLFNLDVRIDNKLRPRISLSREILIFPRTAIFGSYEYQADFGWVSNFPTTIDFEKEITWNVGLEYFLSRDFSLMGSYDNRFGAGGGLSIRF